MSIVKFSRTLLLILSATVILLFGFVLAGICSPDAGSSTQSDQKKEEIEKSKDTEDVFQDYIDPKGIELLSSVHHRKKSAKKTSLANSKRKAAPARKVIALTFDDGPHQEYTPDILRILKERDVKATFFVVGSMAECYPYLIRAEFRGGHTVGNHTYHHQKLSELTPEEIQQEIKVCDDSIERITGVKAKFFRPSGGNYNGQVVSIAHSLGYSMILWSVDPCDIANPGVEEIVNRIMRRASNGGVILLHDGVRQTIDALPAIIEVLKSRGYEFVTIDELMSLK